MIDIEETKAYKTSDGSLFDNEIKAYTHQLLLNFEEWYDSGEPVRLLELE